MDTNLQGANGNVRQFLNFSLDLHQFFIFRYLVACTHVTAISGVLMVGFLVVQYLTRHDEVDTEKKPYELIGGKVLMAESEVKYFAIAFVICNVILRVFSYRFPLRIYKDGQKYLAVLEGQLPMTKAKYEFVRGAVKEIPPRGILPWKDSRFLVNNERRFIMIYESFRTPSELFEMLKKPIKPRKYLEEPRPI